MAFDRPEDLVMDDFLFQETDSFALPLLDFDPEEALLAPAELVMGQTHLQQTQDVPFPTQKQPTSPLSTDDGSTDAEVSTPPPAFEEMRVEMDAALSPAARVALLDSAIATHSPLSSDQKLLAPRTTTTCNSNSSNTTPAKTAKQTQPMPFPGAVPYALPVAYFPPLLHANQKRPFPQVLPDSKAPTATTPASSGADDSNSKKSKREIRQMKNRESANKSRLRRKAQLTTLTTEVTELKKKEQELQTIIAGLRAENKSLLDQNTFLRSLVTSFKQEPSSSNTHQVATAFASLPLPIDQNCVALNMLESGQKMSVEGEDQGVDLATTRPGKRRAVTSTLSTASLAVCASVFGITLFTDYDSDVVDSANIRGVGRVLHEAPTACGMEGCASEASTSVVGFVMTAVRSWWQFVSSSELVFGVLLNVLSFVAIVALYQLWQSHGWSWKYPLLSKPERCGVRRQTSLASSGFLSKDETRSGRDVRLRDSPFRSKKNTEESAM
ncbi:hypothetical protein PHMEG_00018180 [Phytophthora megakarya]|uniref:BZIP domain-containing protein n=1 Tax=Phytophthora megakarya TaxID=4795 RepID=A0A225VX74_9STRA|nr:hypothetical protein PHMEG_00018180 [Phytophthora megakarya]